MSPHQSPASDRIVTALRAIFGHRLRSVVAYGPHVENGSVDVAEPLSCLALVADLTIADLEASAARHTIGPVIRLRRRCCSPRTNSAAPSTHFLSSTRKFFARTRCCSAP